MSPRTKKLLPWTIAGTLILFIGLVWILRHWQGDIATEPLDYNLTSTESRRPVIPEEFRGSAIAPMTLAERAVLDQHFAAVGGVERIASISSLRIAGKVTFPNGETEDVTIIKKGGDRLRLTIKTPVIMRVAVVSPKDNWTATWRQGQLASVEDMDKEEHDLLQQNTYIASELYMALQNSWDIQYLGQKDFNYKMAHVFEVKVSPRHHVRFFIDPDSFLDVGREDLSFAEDGTLTLTRRYNKDHFESNGLMIPRLIESYINDKLNQSFTIELAELNPGIIETSFTRPVMESVTP